jgi:hypothetical protein
VADESPTRLGTAPAARDTIHVAEYPVAPCENEAEAGGVLEAGQLEMDFKSLTM